MSHQRTMTPEEFLSQVMGSDPGRDKGQARFNRIRRYYMAYLAMYKSGSLRDALSSYGVAGFFEQYAMRLAAKDRDEGKPMIVILEFLGSGERT